ncbi:conserved hypothetical protein [Alkaliphilus metalliredigens QYMF]|uniref:Uncharacterized protein n=1 Tax=Alkaliphilus metalliredigens (strain QYMF) TaxID=293826 RepID=A6TSS2_ALKMQ|nr:hypothetical protein [Alkaliphilus metalliredigens]ABR49240.1 conserved hypothetical protein [Alkaliphilus metalliredigens QYMF]
MKRQQWLTFAQIGQLILFFITISYFLPSDYAPYFIGQYIVLIISFTFLSQSKSFILLITYTMVTGVTFLFIGFIREWEASLQWRAILYHFILTSNAAISYSSAYFSRQLQENNAFLSKRINELLNYVGDSGLLTKQEFEKRSKLIKKAMARRHEQGYQIYFSLEKINPYTQKSAFDTLTNLAVTVFRSEYDLVGKWNDHSFVLLLQNTDEPGMEISLNRYFSTVTSRMNLKESDFVIKIEAIGHSQGQVITI